MTLVRTVGTVILMILVTGCSDDGRSDPQRTTAKVHEVAIAVGPNNSLGVPDSLGAYELLTPERVAQNNLKCAEPGDTFSEGDYFYFKPDAIDRMRGVSAYCSRIHLGLSGHTGFVSLKIQSWDTPEHADQLAAVPEGETARRSEASIHGKPYMRYILKPVGSRSAIATTATEADEVEVIRIAQAFQRSAIGES